MPAHTERSLQVIISIENFERDRCVDIFFCPDGSYRFEEFRRDPEDQGRWTPINNNSYTAYDSKKAALTAAMNNVVWLVDALIFNPSVLNFIK